MDRRTSWIGAPARSAPQVDRSPIGPGGSAAQLDRHHRWFGDAGGSASHVDWRSSLIGAQVERRPIGASGSAPSWIGASSGSAPNWHRWIGAPAGLAPQLDRRPRWISAQLAQVDPRPRNREGKERMGNDITGKERKGTRKRKIGREVMGMEGRRKERTGILRT